MLRILLAVTTMVAADFTSSGRAPDGNGGFLWIWKWAMSSDASVAIAIEAPSGKKAYTFTGYDYQGGAVKDLNQVLSMSSGNLKDVAISGDGTTGCIVAQGFGVFLSKDSGATWSVVNLDVRHWIATAINSDGSKILVASYPHFGGGQYEGFLFLSSDGGTTWTQLSPRGRIRDVTISPDGQIIMASMEEGKIHISTNGGSNFTESGSNNKWSHLAMSSDGTKIIAATIYTGTPGFISTDGGATWTQPTMPSSGTSIEWDGVAMSADGSMMYVIGNGKPAYIYSSTDGSTFVEEPGVTDDWDSISMSGNIVVAVDTSREAHTKNFPAPVSTTSASGAAGSTAAPGSTLPGSATNSCFVQSLALVAAVVVFPFF